MRQRYMEPRAKQVVLDLIGELPEITVDNIMDLARPHFFFDMGIAREQALRRYSNGLMQKFRDETGARVFFQCNDDSGSSKYVNTEKTDSIPDLDKIDDKLGKQIVGISKSRKKIAVQRQILAGQTVLKEMNEKG